MILDPFMWQVLGAAFATGAFVATVRKNTVTLLTQHEKIERRFERMEVRLDGIGMKLDRVQERVYQLPCTKEGTACPVSSSPEKSATTSSRSSSD